MNFKKKVFENIKNFFQRSSKHYRSAWRVLIRRPKRRTETEIKLNSSYHNSIVHKIDFNFEITAPKVIFPQDFYKKNPLVVIFDFGRLALVNRNNNLNVSLIERTKSSSEAAFKKSQTDANFGQLLPLSQSGSGQDMLTDSVLRPRRSSMGINLLIGGKNSSDDEDDDIFVTPSSTPTNERIERMNKLDVSEGSIETNLYSIYDLYLNDLQTVIGKIFLVSFIYSLFHTHINLGRSALPYNKGFFALQIKSVKQF